MSVQSHRSNLLAELHLRNERPEKRSRLTGRVLLGTLAVALCTNVSGENCNGDRYAPLPLLGDPLRQQIYHMTGQGASSRSAISFGIPLIEGAQLPLHQAEANIWGFEEDDSCG